MKKRAGDWTITYTGKQFWPCDPQPDEIDLRDIAHALALSCRWGGHVTEFYSVAQHSVLVSHEAVEYSIADPVEALQGLLHDATEAYLCDLIRPIKNNSKLGREYKLMEDRLHTAIMLTFGLPEKLPSCVLHADNVVLATEARDLIHPGFRDCILGRIGCDPAPARIVPWTPESAEVAFLHRFEELDRLRGGKG